MTNSFYKYNLPAALACLGGAAISYFAGALNWTGFLLVAGLLFPAIGRHGSEKLLSFSYPAVIFAMAGAGMFYPQYLVQVDDVKFSVLILPLLPIIRFGMGTTMTFREIAAGIILIGSSPSGLTSQMGKIATLGPAPAIFSSLMNIPGSIQPAGGSGQKKISTVEIESLDRMVQ